MTLKLNFFSFFFIAFLFQTELFASSVSWNLPSQTLENQGSDVRIATDNTGKFVYAVYATSNNLNVQVSSNFGVDFSSSITLGTASNDIPQIVTSGTGQYVYVIWLDASTILVSASSDFGKFFSMPFQLEASADASSEPQITTDSSGENVFAIWRDASANIQTRTSTDFGVSWFSAVQIDSAATNPFIVTNNDGSNVYAIWATSAILTRATSNFGGDIQLDSAGINSKITTTDSGQYVHAIWEDSSNDILVATSSNFGLSWNSAVTFTSSGALTTNITTNATGQYVYATWDDATNIRTRVSSNFGQSFTTINLSETGSRPKILTDSSGRYVYLIWLDTTNHVQTRISTNFGATFEPSIQLTSSAVSGFTIPDIAIGRSGKYVYVTWAAFNAPVSIGFVNGIRLVSSKNVSIINQ